MRRPPHACAAARRRPWSALAREPDRERHQHRGRDHHRRDRGAGRRRPQLLLAHRRRRRHCRRRGRERRRAPGAAKDWSAQVFGDAPTAKRRVFAGISAAAACADPGCGASAAVGSSWVRVDLLTVGLGEGTSVFAGETEDTLFANARPAIATVFATVQRATAAQLRFPSHVGTRGASDCRTFLKPGPLAAAMGVRSASYAEPGTRTASRTRSPAPRSTGSASPHASSTVPAPVRTAPRRSRSRRIRPGRSRPWRRTRTPGGR